eukprot:TRINITY_DN57536_c0_g1_i1.p1 TRINITY_DN57536_c0_g1~~TRINITY_DN57536_c0_g1_i1.p1  ORF type:complete len:141 (+),score=16.77 TRINITY_DN57536_c0_g1_i1:102-524(+)
MVVNRVQEVGRHKVYIELTNKERMKHLGDLPHAERPSCDGVDSIDLLRLAKSSNYAIGTRNSMNNNSTMLGLTLGPKSWDPCTGGLRSTYMASSGATRRANSRAGRPGTGAGEISGIQALASSMSAPSLTLRLNSSRAHA